MLVLHPGGLVDDLRYFLWMCVSELSGKVGFYYVVYREQEKAEKGYALVE